VTIN
jgi:hypothetical protein